MIGLEDRFVGEGFDTGTLLSNSANDLFAMENLLPHIGFDYDAFLQEFGMGDGLSPELNPSDMTRADGSLPADLPDFYEVKTETSSTASDLYSPRGDSDMGLALEEEPVKKKAKKSNDPGKTKGKKNKRNVIQDSIDNFDTIEKFDTEIQRLKSLLKVQEDGMTRSQKNAFCAHNSRCRARVHTLEREKTIFALKNRVNQLEEENGSLMQIIGSLQVASSPSQSRAFLTAHSYDGKKALVSTPTQPEFPRSFGLLRSK